MNTLTGCTRALLLIVVGPLSAVFVCSALASAATPTTATTLTFKEPEKDSTFTYVDVAPTAPKVHGVPISVSPGDQLILTNRLTEGGRTIGKLRARCTATEAIAKITDAAFAQAHFICEGMYTLPGGSLYANASIVKSGTKGVVTGGTGKYAGARGTFVSKDAKGGTDTTVNLFGE